MSAHTSLLRQKFSDPERDEKYNSVTFDNIKYQTLNAHLLYNSTEDRVEEFFKRLRSIELFIDISDGYKSKSVWQMSGEQWSAWNLLYTTGIDRDGGLQTGYYIPLPDFPYVHNNYTQLEYSDLQKSHRHSDSIKLPAKKYRLVFNFSQLEPEDHLRLSLLVTYPKPLSLMHETALQHHSTSTFLTASKLQTVEFKEGAEYHNINLDLKSDRKGYQPTQIVFWTETSDVTSGRYIKSGKIVTFDDDKENSHTLTEFYSDFDAWILDKYNSNTNKVRSLVMTCTLRNVDLKNRRFYNNSSKYVQDRTELQLTLADDLPPGISLHYFVLYTCDPKTFYQLK